jgi:hypothetical protein
MRVIIPILIIAFAIFVALQGHPYQSSPVMSLSTDLRDAAAEMRKLDQTTTRPITALNPWADDLTAYANAHPGNWIVGRCHEPCASEAEAAKAAHLDAARQVYPLVLQSTAVARGEAPWLSHRLMPDIESGELQTDQLVEHFTRPYGTVWTESVLLDASPPRIATLSNRYSAELRPRQARLRIVRAAGAVSIFAAWGMYLLLNMFTRGYFTTRLRLGAALITAMAIVAIA